MYLQCFSYGWNTHFDKARSFVYTYKQTLLSLVCSSCRVIAHHNYCSAFLGFNFVFHRLGKLSSYITYCNIYALRCSCNVNYVNKANILCFVIKTTIESSKYIVFCHQNHWCSHTDSVWMQILLRTTQQVFGINWDQYLSYMLVAVELDLLARDCRNLWLIVMA